MNNEIDSLLYNLAKLEKLPPIAQGHRERFELRIAQKRSRLFLRTVLPSAASFLLLVALSIVGQFEIMNLPSDNAASYFNQEIDSRFHTIQTTYGKDYGYTVEKTRKHLTRLDLEYKRLEKEFLNKHEHPLLLKAMIENLHQRLRILNN